MSPFGPLLTFLRATVLSAYEGKEDETRYPTFATPRLCCPDTCDSRNNAFQRSKNRVLRA
jgi:hypothetical protein